MRVVGALLLFAFALLTAEAQQSSSDHEGESPLPKVACKYNRRLTVLRRVRVLHRSKNFLSSTVGLCLTAPSIFALEQS